ncbi:hypothetical protein BDR04DRAFT_1122339 [Suillus decipiens]|nr:hypothetical protein BDR04DRAFT_1122339 [Suillus decipiens]
MIKYGRKWIPRMVIYQQNWEEVLKRIEDESGAKPGAPRMFKHYQVAVKRVMVELDEDKLEKAKEIAEEWLNNFSPPKTSCRHDDNEALGDDDSFMKMKDWEAIKTVWQERNVLIVMMIGAGAWDRGRHVKGGWKRIQKPAFKLKVDGDGMPVLLDITKTKLEEKKAIVRAFLTLHYWLAILRDYLPVPDSLRWKDLDLSLFLLCRAIGNGSRRDSMYKLRHHSQK